MIIAVYQGQNYANNHARFWKLSSFLAKNQEISQIMIVLSSNLVKTPLTNYGTKKLMANTFTLFTSRNFESG